MTFSGVRGVLFDPKENAWVAQWSEFGIRRFKYFHVGEQLTGPNGEDMSIRSEVGLLSRNVRIVGSLLSEIPNRFCSLPYDGNIPSETTNCA